MNQNQQTSWEKIEKAKEYLQLAYFEIIQALSLQIEEKDMAPNQVQNILDSSKEIYLIENVKLFMLSPKKYEEIRTETAIKEPK